MEIITTHKSCSGVREYKHYVYLQEPHPQSYAALILITRQYIRLDPEANPEINWQIYKWRRKQVLKEHFAKYGKYICTYCKRDDLTEDIKQSNVRRVTIDHIIPIGRGGRLTAKNNMTICCSACNNKKGDQILTDSASFMPSAT